MLLMQTAAAAIADSHPQGIDYLVINAAINDNHVGPALDLCATRTPHQWLCCSQT